MRPWDQERLGLLALGFSRVLFVNVSCPRHGTWRVGLAEESEQYPCPCCGQAAKAEILAEGFTRRDLPLAPELVDKPLPLSIKRLLLCGEAPIVKPRRVANRHARKISAATLWR